MQDILLMVIAAIFVNNILLMQFLGNCPFLGVSKSMDTALGMAMAVVFVMVLAATISYITQVYLLVPLGLEYLQTITFILVIAALVQLVEMFLKKAVPPLYRSLGIFLPLITTNCAVMGVCLLAVQKEYNFVQTIIFSFASAVGYGLALVLFAGWRERFAVSPIPKTFRGTAIGLICAGLIALAFMGFIGMVK
ncbi:MAG TPA: electron transport complex subunit RsxA [bacterium]|nr:electron transport complex subunit RsxA [bacterium]